ncbi:PH domain-containing protein [Kineosporia succinea]|uniref:Membrane protein YdbS with pleckstrin-like domain n=1 Tax=Kineosporia succinea TaxID=84632 RepID=A0ABT9P2Y5_9ACTN|nr:PH domain-containing protein [Kineosporia succinea]MDP9827046.1 membrane protein YdbS with pleckstrin-like domain [Kineosporia succinea]
MAGTTDGSLGDVFDADGVVWTPVSQRLASARRAWLGLETVVGAVVLAIPAVLWTPWFWIGVAAVVAAFFWGWWLVGRQVRAWGYAERADDLLIRHGVMFRELVVVPYGRMQFVDVQAGPVDQLFGVAHIQLHTASAGTDARIPGLIAAEASRLRDRLASRGEARLAGL